jgi:hypothetical protein
LKPASFLPFTLHGAELPFNRDRRSTTTTTTTSACSHPVLNRKRLARDGRIPLSAFAFGFKFFLLVVLLLVMVVVVVEVVFALGRQSHVGESLKGVERRDELGSRLVFPRRPTKPGAASALIGSVGVTAESGRNAQGGSYRVCTQVVKELECVMPDLGRCVEEAESEREESALMRRQLRQELRAGKKTRKNGPA